MTCRLPERRDPILKPTIRGWETDDGFLLVLRRGNYSTRPIGRITDPTGRGHLLAGGKHEPLSALVDLAEREILRIRDELMSKGATR